MKEASDLFYEINDWAEQTFGKDRDPKMILKHLEEELGELSNEVRRLRGGFTTDKMDFMKEYADMQILLWNLADTMGMCYNSCVDSVMIKHNINKARTYVEVDGKMKHVPDEVEAKDVDRSFPEGVEEEFLQELFIKNSKGMNMSEFLSQYSNSLDISNGTGFSEEEVEASKRVRAEVILSGDEKEKAIFMAGEICVWNAMKRLSDNMEEKDEKGN